MNVIYMYFNFRYLQSNFLSGKIPISLRKFCRTKGYDYSFSQNCLSVGPLSCKTGEQRSKDDCKGT